MPVDYSKFVGIQYVPPHGCFHLVRKVLEEGHGLDLGNPEKGLKPWSIEERTQRLQSYIAENAREVDNPQEGDVVLIRSDPWHLGIVVRPGEMLHSYRGGSSCVEPYTIGRWRNKIIAFYRLEL